MSQEKEGQKKEEAEKEGKSDQKASFDDIRKKTSQDMDMLLDIPMDVSTELGQTNMKVRDILALSEGSVIELAKLVGEPMEIFINGLMIARGEVVVVNERFGVRVTDVIDQFEERRIAYLDR